MSQQQSSERTEKPTPKRRREAREKGQVFKSVEVITAFSLLAMFGVLSIFGKTIVENIHKMMHYFFSQQSTLDTLTISAMGNTLKDAILLLIEILAPILIAAFTCGLIFNVVQVGLNFAPKAMAPKMNRISPISGFKRIFSTRTLLDLLKSLIKIAVLGFVAYGEYQKYASHFPILMGEPADFAVNTFVEILFNVGFKLALALAIFAPFDFMYQRWKHEKDLMMTKQEVKDEYKLVEGNPQNKSRIAQKQREMSNMRMVQAVKDADVVITNPTHYAVALSYKEEEYTAPLVIAKGQDYLAKKIKERAKEHEVEIVENKSLARALYFFCEVGDEVPEDLYKAVAEVLAYVYRLKNPRR